MISVFLAGALALGAMQQQTDTTFAVRPGGTLEVNVFGGRANIRTWDRSDMRIRTSHGRHIDVRIRQRGNNVLVAAEQRGGVPATGVRLDIVVPRTFNLRLEGMNLSTDVEELQGSVQVETMEGQVSLRNVTGNITVETVSGPLRMNGITGAVQVTAVNQNVIMERMRGNIAVETINGSVVIRDADGESVSVSTINGFIEYDGRIRDGGRYFLGTHNGRITMSVPEQANARIQVAARTGKVEAAFPVSLGSTSSDRFAISVGTGSARVDLESFNGTIRLVRPGGR